MKHAYIFLFVLMASVTIVAMEDDNRADLTSSNNTSWLSKIARLGERAKDNVFGHGDGYLKEMHAKQPSFRAHDLPADDMLLLTHRGEWAIAEFLREKNNDKLQETLELTKQHYVRLNPDIVDKAKKRLGQCNPGPRFIQEFKDKEPELTESIKLKEKTRRKQLAELAIVQYIEEEQPTSLNTVLTLCTNHKISVNPDTMSDVQIFFHTYQTQKQQTILKLLASIKEVERYKRTSNNIQLPGNATEFNYEAFAKELQQELPWEKQKSKKK